jgi:hypothetical protein
MIWYRSPNGLALKPLKTSSSPGNVMVCAKCHEDAPFRAMLCPQGVLTLTCDTCGSVVMEITATWPSGEPWIAEPTRTTIH